ncbi:MAG: hypothetical protein A2X46_04635 [Lentisphaerae bacterium GWF2_57_35]|nr:MAG: hypothetical protein A2X46_04635 [Lentisphaerae bacterium GWF2_57_35]
MNAGEKLNINPYEWLIGPTDKRQATRPGSKNGALASAAVSMRTRVRLLLLLALVKANHHTACL